MTINAQALILDFGSVITKSFFETHRQTEATLGLPGGALDWMGPFDPHSDSLWRSMQAGEISERDYWLSRSREVGEMVGENWSTMAEFVQRSRGADPMAIIRPEAMELIAAAHDAGRKLAILSNELDLFFGKALRTRLTFLKDFDVIVDATYTQILKPDPRAYRLCLEQLEMPAKACVFVDDQQRNVSGAEAVGLIAVHFDVRDPRRAFATARHYLGLTQ